VRPILKVLTVRPILKVVTVRRSRYCAANPQGRYCAEVQVLCGQSAKSLLCGQSAKSLLCGQSAKSLLCGCRATGRASCAGLRGSGSVAARFSAVWTELPPLVVPFLLRAPRRHLQPGGWRDLNASGPIAQIAISQRALVLYGMLTRMPHSRHDALNARMGPEGRSTGTMRLGPHWSRANGARGPVNRHSGQDARMGPEGRSAGTER